MMIGRPNWLPRQAQFWVWWAVIAFSPALVVAQTDAAVSPNSPIKQSAANSQAGTGNKTVDDLLNLDIEQLARTPVVVPSVDISVRSVTKQESTVGRSAAAVFVITPEMIHSSLALVGQNLLQTYHYEFGGNTASSPTYATEVPRGVYGTLTWRH